MPDIAEAPSQSDSFAGRPACQEQFKALWPQMVANQPADNAYRRLYYYLHKLVDQAIGRILDALEASGMADDTIIVFTSDHGDLLGAHGGLQQKWANAFDEATRVPMVIKGPGVASLPGGITAPTSHVDLIPTLLGLAGIDVERAAAGVAQTPHGSPTAAGPRPQRHRHRPRCRRVDRRGHLLHDRGQRHQRAGSGQRPHRRTVQLASNAPAVHRVGRHEPAHRRRRRTRALEAQPLLRATRRVERRPRNHGDAGTPPAAEPAWELHNLTVDPEERTNLSTDAPETFSEMRDVFEAQREREAAVAVDRYRSLVRAGCRAARTSAKHPTGAPQMSRRQVFLLVAAIGLLPVALSYGLAPGRSLEFLFDVSIENVNGTHMFRAIMGLYLGFILFWIIGAFREMCDKPLSIASWFSCSVWLLGDRSAFWQMDSPTGYS